MIKYNGKEFVSRDVEVIDVAQDDIMTYDITISVQSLYNAICPDDDPDAMDVECQNIHELVFQFVDDDDANMFDNKVSSKEFAEYCNKNVDLYGLETIE